MAFLKYAHSKIAAVGSLKDILPADEVDRGIAKVASLLPVSRVMDDYLYVRSWAVSAGEVYGPNDNMDYFEAEELKKSYASFINTGFFKDHANHDIRLAYGLNLDAVYTPKDFVATISAVKKAGLQPDQEEIANGIKTGAIDQVSMGCQVEQSICSNCGNSATNLNEYCYCLTFGRGQRIAELSGYCEDCGVEAARCEHIQGANKLGISFNKSANSSTIKGSLLYEINRGCTFFDLSAITTVAADRNARIAEVIEKQAGNELFNYIKPLPKEVIDLGGREMGDKLEKEAAEKETGGAHPDQPVKPVDAGDYDHKGNDSGRPEYGLSDSGKSEAADKTHDIMERGRVDKGEYGPAGEDKKAKKPDTHNMYKDDAGVAKSQDVESYRAKSASKEDSEFLGALKDFFSGLVEKKAEKKPSGPVEINYKALDEARASLRDDLESLQEAQDALHTEKVKLMAKVTNANLSVIKKRAQAEVDLFEKMEEKIKEARKMVLTAAEEMEEKAEEEAKGESDKPKDDKKDDDKKKDSDSDSGMKAEVLEIREEIDELLDEVVEVVAPKKKEEKSDMPPFMKKDDGDAAGPEMPPMGDAPAPDMAPKKDFGLGVMDRNLSLAQHKCDKTCQAPKKCASLRNEARKQIMAYREAMKKKAAEEKSESSAHPNQPAESKPKDAGDYDHSDTKWNTKGGAGESYNKRTDKETRAQIKGEMKDMSGRQQEQKKHGSVEEKPKEWLALRRFAALTKEYVEKGMPLKEAKTKALDELERRANQYKEAKAKIEKSSDFGEEMKEKMVDNFSSKMLEAIGLADPSRPENVAAGESVHDAPNLEDGGEAKMKFSDPEVPPKAVASLQPKEAYAKDEDSDKSPSDPYWDLFPEDNITSAVSEANGEMSSRSKGSMRGVTASVSGVQAPFSNNAAYDKQEKKAAKEGDSLMGSDSIQKALEAIGLANREVEAGLIDEAAMEEEAKRLFYTSPEELKATAGMVEKVAKRNFKSPVPEGYMKQAISMGEGGGETKDEALFENDGHIF
jgi:hypothetical protein